MSGNLKFDIAPPADQLELAQTFRGWRGARRTILAASTREGEEIPLLAAFMQYRRPGDLLILVPRHPSASPRWRHWPGTRPARRPALGGEDHRSSDRGMDRRQHGEMFAYYAAADVALIGGSWQPLGGQNLIEACAVGTPVVMGPHTFNFAEASRLAIEAGAALRAEDVDHGMRLALALLDQAAERASMAAAGKAFARAHGGATEKRCACSTGWRTRIRMARAERWDRASLDLADPHARQRTTYLVRHGSSEASANAAVNTAFAGTTCASPGALKVAWPSARGTPRRRKSVRRSL